MACAISSAILTHLGVRASGRFRRGALFVGALLLLCSAFFFGAALGGFWAGFYTLLSVYFLTTVITPWISFLTRASDDC